LVPNRIYNHVSWTSAQTISLLAAATALLAAFVALQARLHEQLVPLGIFRRPDLSAANVVMALLGAAWIPLWFFLNLYLQQMLGYGAFKGGAALLPMTVAIMLLMVGVTGRLVARVGPKPLLVTGLPLLAAGSLWFAFIPCLAARGASLRANLSRGSRCADVTVPVQGSRPAGW
jgi:hypothetical protein